MDRPLDIAFHNMQSSSSLEAEIRRQAERLDRRSRRLIGCRVSVEALHQQHRRGNVVDVHITLSVPGRDLVVSREPHKARQHHAHPSAYSSVRDAFRAAERRLDAWKAQLTEDTTKPTGSALTGEVMLIEPGADHGFLLTSRGSQLYFHQDSVTNASLADLREGMVVHYVEEEGESGPVAGKVRVAPRP
ncbi:MAG TPA: HPF/RaiA family ribosome-associated protein [Acidisoma sp.]|uniref:HPF/RaiA family ribosome-associated protein n=1 Tax=Acidisoma sp. TaxID=1872115 RepID=UPI002BCA91EC|nr:HPF/RaiA family ribosome-associated protein [Acidisoma sp.]HTI01495.1 HPF/RaiA family ribosome-associated protein [Acidisoma sp.]